jgi:uncharacterized membrane protein
MSDRYNGFVVTFSTPIKDEDAENLKIALGSIKGVLSVNPIVEDVRSLCAKQQIRYELTQKLWKALESG